PNGLFKNAPNPNAGRLFQSFCFSPQGQQLSIDAGGLRSLHPQTKEKPGRKPFGEIKKMKDDPAEVERTSADVKAHYSRILGVEGGSRTARGAAAGRKRRQWAHSPGATCSRHRPPRLAACLRPPRGQRRPNRPRLRQS